MRQQIPTRLFFLGLVFLLVLFTTSEGRADSLTLAWDPNPESEVVGYYVFIGTSPGAPTIVIDVGNTTTYTFTSAVPDSTYYLTVAAYVTGPVVGPPAPEVIASTNITPTLADPGDRFANVGAPTTLTIAAADPHGEPISLVALGLPPGLVLGGSTKTISGVPTLAGIYPVTLTALNPSGIRATRSFLWTITQNDVSAPSVAVIGPTAATSYSTTTAFVTLTGTATDDVGVTSVAWSSSAGRGTAAGTREWSVIVPLKAGANLITMTAYDAAGRAATDSISVTYQAPAPAPSPVPTPVSTGVPAPAPQPTVPSAPKTPKPSRAQVRSLTANLRAPGPIGRSITFAAVASGGAGTYQYQWLVYDGRRWTVLRTWSTSPTFNWTPAIVNSKYRVRVWVKSQGAPADSLDSPDDVKTMDFPVTRS